VISIIDLAVLQADTDHRPWVDHVEVSPHADVLDHRLGDTETDTRAEEGQEAVEEVSVAAETILDPDLDAPSPALGLDRLDAVHHTRGHGLGALHGAGMAVVTEGESLLMEAEAGVVDAVQASAPMEAIVGVGAGAGAGAGDAGLLGDRRPFSCLVEQ
jgi:hypothetical protein